MLDSSTGILFMGNTLNKFKSTTSVNHVMSESLSNKIENMDCLHAFAQGDEKNVKVIVVFMFSGLV